MTIARIARVVRKPPGYVARRALAETRRTAHRCAIAAASAGRGRLCREQIIPDGMDLALERTRGQSLRLGRWADGIAATREDPSLRAELEHRRKQAFARQLELFSDELVPAGRPPRWNTDVRTGHGWPQTFHGNIDYRNLGRGSDVKVAWEMSRLRHCVALAQSVGVLRDAEALRAIEDDLTDWHAHNALGWSVNWACAMEVALRAVNLICIDGILLAANDGYAFRRLLVGSLYQHGWFLHRNLEISDVNGNHFLANAVGLLWLAQFFAGIGEAERWRTRGLAMVEEAARSQVLKDGLDHEGSLPYHLLVLEMFLLARSVEGGALRVIDRVLAGMLDAACLFVGPDGRVPDIGDDDGGRVAAFSDLPSRDARRVLALGAALLGHPRAAARAAGTAPHDVLWLLGREAAGRLPELAREATVGPPRRLLGAGGIAILGRGTDHVVADVGAIGFRGRGGHGHLDAMSFEATLGGKLVVRDSGTGSYTGDPVLREELRAPRAHSVVVIDGLPYARLGGPERLWAIDGDSPPKVTAFEDGAERQVLRAIQVLPARERSASHERELDWRPGRLTCRDVVKAPAGAVVEHLLQAPGDVELDAEGGAVGASARYRVRAPSEAVLRVEACRYSTRYGSVDPGRRLILSYRAGDCPSEVTWEIEAR